MIIVARNANKDMVKTRGGGKHARAWQRRGLSKGGGCCMMTMFEVIHSAQVCLQGCSWLSSRSYLLLLRVKRQFVGATPTRAHMLIG